MFVFVLCGVNSAQEATALQQQQQYQMMQYAADREQDPEEPTVDAERTALDFFNSDLNLEIARDG